MLYIGHGHRPLVMTAIPTIACFLLLSSELIQIYMIEYKWASTPPYQITMPGPGPFVRKDNFCIRQNWRDALTAPWSAAPVVGSQVSYFRTRGLLETAERTKGSLMITAYHVPRLHPIRLAGISTTNLRSWNIIPEGCTTNLAMGV
jgi:hypothetical protein